LIQAGRLRLDPAEKPRRKVGQLAGQRIDRLSMR